jgi:hypothetical protein
MTSALPPAPWETSVPSLRAVWKEAAETSMRAPIGREAKRDEDAPSSVETGVGSDARTGRKRGFDAGAEGEAEAEIKGEGEGLRIVLAAGSWAEVSKTSFQPWCVF